MCKQVAGALKYWHKGGSLVMSLWTFCYLTYIVGELSYRMAINNN